MNALIFETVWYIVSLIMAGGLISSGFVKLFARQLTYWRALLISISAWSVTAIMMASFYASRVVFGFSQWWLESITCAIGLSVAGILITKLARAYGVQKTGRLGVGAKSILPSIALGWLLFGILLMLTPMS